MKKKPGLHLLTTFFLFLFSLSFFTVSGIAAPEKSDPKNILKAYAKQPPCFVKNQGQLDLKVKFYVKTPCQTLYFTDEGIVFDLLRGGDETEKRPETGARSHHNRGVKKEQLVFNLNFENTRKEISIEGLNRQEAEINYFTGNDRDKWKRGIPTFKGIVYKEVYKNIDLKIFGNGRAIEYEFIINPGGNPDDILLTYNGIDGLTINKKGELLIATTFGELKETRPYIYQEIVGKRVVAGNFEIHNPAETTQSQTLNRKTSYGFQIAAYDPAYPLIIDPTLSYSTYLGGSANDYGRGIAVDGSGNAYITGYTYSSNFPTQNPHQGTKLGIWTAFVTKLSATGDLLYSSYLGGKGNDYGYGIAVDDSGCAYITGYTESDDFPTTPDSYQNIYAGGDDTFVVKLDPSGDTLAYSTYLGGSGNDQGRGIAVDSFRNTYITGCTSSTNFPLQNPDQETHAGNWDAFITKLDPSGSILSYSTYLGGDDEDRGHGIAVDNSGIAYVTGDTKSKFFPRKLGTRGFAGNTDVFIARFSPFGSRLYSSCLGGVSNDHGIGIALDDSGNFYITGYTNSYNFPTKNPFQESRVGNAFSYDAFVCKFSPYELNDNLRFNISYSTYLGGTANDYGYGIALNNSGNAYVTGYTLSNNFPTQNPYQKNHTGNIEVFITKLSATGDALTYSTYLGGSSSDYGYGIAVDGSGNAYVTGETSSSNFPTQNPYQENNAEGYDLFVAKLSHTPILTTGTVTNINTTTATGSGEITDLGDPVPAQYGVCWNTFGTPIITDGCTKEGKLTKTGSFTTVITDLSPYTTYYVRAYATNNAGVIYGRENSFTTIPLAPTVATQTVTDIGTISATGHGNISAFELPDPAQHGVCWNTIGNPSITDHKTEEGKVSATGSFTSEMTNLLPNTTYYVRAYAKNCATPAYGAEVSFTSAPLAPTATTQDATNIDTTTAIANGRITDLGTPKPFQHGVCWNTTGNPSITDNKSEEGAASNTGFFASMITDLSPNTTYHVRAYATNTAGTTYGRENSFTTAALPSMVTTQAVTGIGTISATGHGNITDLGTPNPTQHGVCWNLSGNPSITDSCTENGASTATGPFTTYVAGLSPNTTYYVRAYTSNAAGTTYGAENFFTTVPMAPMITTQAADNINANSAAGHGKIMDLGAPNPNQHGICWNRFGNPSITDHKTEEGNAWAIGPFTSRITGLLPDTTYYVRAYTTNTVDTAYGGEIFFTTAPRAPTVTTQAVTDIDIATAIGNGEITDLGIPNLTQYGVCWNTAGNPTIADDKTEEGKTWETGFFSSKITKISSNTTYYVRAYASYVNAYTTNNLGTSYGAEFSFTTVPLATPTVTTQAVTGISTTSATGNAKIIDPGTPNLTQHGICWNTAGNPSIADNKTEEGETTDSFTSDLTKLSPNTTYYVRAYATNDVGTTYGGEIYFSTSPLPPTVTSQAATNIKPTSATGNGEVTSLGAPNPSQHGICWNTSGNPTITNHKTEEGEATATGSFTSEITNLLPDTTYYLRAYTTNTVDTTYGGQVSLTTTQH